MNIVALTGRLTKDLDLKFTNSGKAVANFTLAVRRDFKNQNGEYEADFVSCQIWGNGAENLAKYTKKGVKIGVSGKIQTRNYDNQQGQRVYVTEVIVNTFDLLEKINENGTNNQQGYHHTPQAQNAPQGNYGANYSNGQNQQNYYAPHPPLDIQEDDLPF